MKFITASALLASGSALEVSLRSNIDLDSASPAFTADEKFIHAKEIFSWTYATAEEEIKALKAFTENEAIIQKHNAKKLSYTLGHNQFSDLSWDDFKAKYVGNYQDNPTLHRAKNYDYSLQNATVAGDALDWSAKGAVTPVKNQGQCGSCWAFSTTGSLEGAYQIAGNPLTSLSEQNLVSCDNKQHGGTDQGCNGGLMDNAFTWISKNGIATEQAYPYTSGTGSTGTCKTVSPSVTLTGHTDVPGESGMLGAISKGPVSVAIEADKSAFQLYKSGVLDNAGCGKKLDHGVLAVGYGTLNGKDYYKVKNSWGGTWGMSGYVLIVQGKDMCGIADSASYPTGAKSMGPSSPTPPPAPTPPTPPPAPQTTHYGDPFKGSCLSDEVNITIQDVSGAICSPKCTGLFKTRCAQDTPAGTIATPQCALSDSSSGNKYCALLCSPSLPITDQQAADDSCGSDEHISCKPIQGQGICTYDS